MTGLLTALLIAGLLAGGTGPARGQEDMETFRKPAWRLTLQYPPGWEVNEESGAVSIVYQGDGDDVAIFAVAQDPDYADSELSLEDLFWIFMDKVGGEAENLTVEDVEPRQIAGVEARSGYLTATDASSGLELDGDIYQLVKGGKGYLVLALSPWDYLEAHQPEFDAMLDSLRIGPTAAPTKTPTPRPRRTARPAATPTEEVVPTGEAIETPEAEPTAELVETPEVEATEEAIETPEAGRSEELKRPEAEVTEEAIETPEAEPTQALATEEAVETPEAEPTEVQTAAPAVTVTPTVTVTAAAAITVTPAVSATPAVTPEPISRAVRLSAREAYELALPRALTWNTSAALVRITGDPLELGGPDAGRSPEWSFYFGIGGEEVDEGFRVKIKDGQVESAAPSDSYRWTIRVDENWLDSPELLEALRAQLGPAFTPEAWYGQATVYSDMAVPPESADGVAQWSLLISDRTEERRNESQTWNVEADAVTGELTAAAAPASEPVQKALTARQALAVAQKEAGNWQQDAQLVFATGQSTPGVPGHQEGQAGTWVFYFSSPSAQEAYQFAVTDGKVAGKQEAGDFAGDPAVTGDWPDSPEVLKDYRQRYPAYAAFSEMYPDHTWDLTLEGKGKTHNWILKAQTDGVTWQADPLRY